MPSSTACSSTRHAAARDRDVPQAGRDDAGDWIGTYGAQGYDIVAGPPASRPRHGHALRPVDLHLDHDHHRPPRLAGPRLANRIAAVWYSATSFTRRRQPRRRPDARPGAVLPRLGQQGPGRAGADQRRGHGHRAEHADDLVVPVGGVPGLDGQREHRDHDHPDGRANAVLNGLFLDPPPARRPRRSSSRTRRRRGLDRHLRRPGLRHRRRPVQPPRLRHGHARRPVDLHLDHHHHRPPRPAGPRLVEPHRRRLVLAHQLHASTSTSPTARRTTSSCTSTTGTTRGRAEQVQISDAARATVLDTADDLVVPARACTWTGRSRATW